MYKFRNDNLDDNYVQYPVMFGAKEYVFTVDRAGRGACVSTSDSYDKMLQEDTDMRLKAIFGDQNAQKRLAELEDEFTVEVKIPKRLANLLWEVAEKYDEDDEDTHELTHECLAREDEIDAAFRPIIEKYFYK